MTERFLPDTRAAVLTISDRCSRGEQTDRSGPTVSRMLAEAGITAIERETLPDERDLITDALRRRSATVQLIVTTGGTGMAPRDVTPEATRLVCERIIDGLAERMRAEGAKHTPLAALSRGICGTLGESLIINLPGSVAGAETSLAAIISLLPHAIDLLAGRTSHQTESAERG